MENLLKPDIGLMFWTVVTFLAMVLILKKIAWGPLLKVLEEREEKIKNDLESALRNKDEMERLKLDYERQMGEIESRARALLSEAEQKGAKAGEEFMKGAQADARKFAEKTRQQLEAEKEKLLRQLRNEVGELSVAMAEKLMRQTIDKKVQDRFVQDFLKNLETPQDKLH
jgi:F-type H+-transporting ATPase subunit b